jgi:nicotinamide-nucleotide amidase
MSAPDADRSPGMAAAGPDDAEVVAAAAELGALLLSLGLKVATAESCTGGLVAAALTETAGSSNWFERGFVTYSNEAKRESLGVPPELLAAHGAVSEPVAAAMAVGALARSRAALAIAITGIAGPGGAVPGKPVGTVCFGWAFAAPGLAGDAPTVRTGTVRFPGDRAEVRRRAALHALDRARREVEAELSDRPPVG